MKKLFYDVETTGTNPRKHSIHQIAALVEIDGQVVERINIHTRPHPKAEYTEAALEVCGKTEQELRAYQPMEEAYAEFLGILGKHVDKFDPKDKFHLVGYNNRFFDDVFLRAWFEQNKDKFIGSWFWNNTLDVIVLASQYLLEQRPTMPSFKLKRVAQDLGIIIEKDKLHDAFYDVEITRKVYRIVVGLDFGI